MWRYLEQQKQLCLDILSTPTKKCPTCPLNAKELDALSTAERALLNNLSAESGRRAGGKM